MLFYQAGRVVGPERDPHAGQRSKSTSMPIVVSMASAHSGARIAKQGSVKNAAMSAILRRPTNRPTLPISL